MEHDLSDQPIRRLAKIINWKPAPSVAKRLKALETQHAIGLSRLSELSTQSVALLYRESVERAENSLRTAKDTSDLITIATPNKSRLVIQLSEQRFSLKEALRVLSAEAAELLKPSLNDFITKARVHTSELQTAELKIAESYGCRHSDSPTINQLNESLDLLAQMFRYRGGYNSPSSMALPIFDL